MQCSLPFLNAIVIPTYTAHTHVHEMFHLAADVQMAL